MTRLPALALLCLLAGCAYNPGFGHGPAYQEALSACQKTASQQADTIVKRRFYTFVTYPVSKPIIARREVRDCLTGKGWKG